MVHVQSIQCGLGVIDTAWDIGAETIHGLLVDLSHLLVVLGLAACIGALYAVCL